MKLAAMAASIEIDGMHDDWISWLINVVISVHRCTVFSLFNSESVDVYLLVLV